MLSFKEKTVVIHQPDFLPYLGFFDRLLYCDLFVILDHVQFERRGWTNRDKIKTPQGERWLTIDVDKAPVDTAINQIFLSQSTEWRKKNLNLLKENYGKAPFYLDVFPYIFQLYDFQCDRMIDFNLKSIEMMMYLLDIKREMMFSSTLDVGGKSNELLAGILQKVGASTYLSGLGARAYFNPYPFAASNIEVVWQNFIHPVYPQLYGEFIPCLSTIDMLFNCGIEESRKILRRR